MKSGNLLRKIMILCGLTLLAIGFTACGRGGNRAAELTMQDIAGEYIETGDTDVKYITLTEDGKFISDITGSMGITMHTENTWDYKDGTLTLHYLEYGVDSKYSVSFKDNTLVLDNGEAKRKFVKKEVSEK